MIFSAGQKSVVSTFSPWARIICLAISFPQHNKNLYKGVQYPSI